MSTAVATGTSKAHGRPSTLTPEVHRALVRAVKKGAPLGLAAEVVGIPVSTFRTWMKRGRGEHPDLPASEPFRSFALDVDRARPALKMHALTTVNRTVKGEKCKGCAGTGEREISTDRGDKLVKCPPCSGTGWQIKPDGRLAMTVLERTTDEYARRDRVSHEHVVSGSVTVDVHVEHTSTSVATSLLSMQSGQLSSILDRLDAPEIIEAEVVEGGG